MSRSYRLPYAAYLIAALAIISFAGTQATRSEHIPHHIQGVSGANADREQRPADGDNTPAANQDEPEKPKAGAGTGLNGIINPTPTNKKAKKDHTYPNCEFDDIAECDLTAQQTMAESTRYMNWATWVTVFLTSVAVFLIWRTLHYTAEAAKFASDTLSEAKVTTKAAEDSVKEARAATREAERTADIQEAALSRLERPYLFPKIVDTQYITNPTSREIPYLRYTVTNHGKLPAITRRIFAEVIDKPKFPLRVPIGQGDFIYRVIEPGCDMPIPIIAPVRNAEPGTPYRQQDSTKLIFHGLIEYEDPTGAIHIDRFCMRANPQCLGFVIEGGSEYNYRQTERPEESPANS